MDEAAFYREFEVFMECGSPAAAFLPCEPMEGPEAHHPPEIDIPPDTLKSSHAYLEPSVASKQNSAA
jgi:hypothetical protein